MPKLNYGFKGEGALTLEQAIAAGAAVSSTDYGYVVQLGAITPVPEPPAADPYYQKVALLAHLNSRTQFNEIVDSSPYARAMRFDGGTLTTTAGDQSPIGGGAMQLNTAGGALYSMLALGSGVNAGTGDFTLEWWANFPNITPINALLPSGEGVILTGPSDGWAGGDSGRWRISVRGISDSTTGNLPKRKLALYYFNQNPSRVENVWSALIDDYLGQWTHYAISRTGGVTRVFANGQQLTLGIDPAVNYPNLPFGTTATSVADTANWVFPMANQPTYNNLGMVLFGFTDHKIVGFVDEVRYTVGVGRYSASFSPPTTAFPDSGPVIAPDAPTNLVATGGNQQVALTWTAPARTGGASITDYIVQFQLSTDNGSNWTTFSDGTSTTASATVTGLTNGTSYRVRVAAVNSAGTGDYVASGTVTPNVAAAITAQPRNDFITADAQSATFSVTATGAGSYQWQYFGPDEMAGDYANAWRDIPNATSSSFAATTSAINSLLGYEFYYTGIAKLRCAVSPAGGGSSTYSNMVRFIAAHYQHSLSLTWYNGTTGGGTTWTGSRHSLSPAAGESVKVDLTDYAMASPDTSWFTGNNGIVKVQRADTATASDANWTDVSSTEFRGSFGGISGIEIPSSTGVRFYRVVIQVKWPYSVNDGSLSAVRTTPMFLPYTSSDYLEVNWPAAPSSPTGLSGSSGNAQVPLTWTAPSSNGGAAITGYVVEWTPAGGSASTVNTGSATASYTKTGLTNGTAYTFRVAAQNSVGTGPYSSSATVTPVAPGPTISYLLVGGGGAGRGGGGGGGKVVEGTMVASGPLRLRVGLGGGSGNLDNSGIDYFFILPSKDMRVGTPSVLGSLSAAGGAWGSTNQAIGGAGNGGANAQSNSTGGIGGLSSLTGLRYGGGGGGGQYNDGWDFYPGGSGGGGAFGGNGTNGLGGGGGGDAYGGGMGGGDGVVVLQLSAAPYYISPSLTYSVANNRYTFTAGDGYVTVAQPSPLSIQIPKMTSNTAPSGTVLRFGDWSNQTSRSWEYFGSASDNVGGFYGQPSIGASAGIGFDFGATNTFSGYYALPHYSQFGTGPSSLTFSGSNDGTNWTVLNTTTFNLSPNSNANSWWRGRDDDGWSWNTTLRNEVTAAGSYRYVRWMNTGSNSFILNKLQLLLPASPAL